MFSPVKFALFAIMSFVALAFATSHPQDPKALVTNTNDPRALINNTNHVLEKTLLPLYYINSANSSSEHITLVIQEVSETVAELVVALRMSSLSGCDCTADDIITLTALMFKIIFEPIGIVYGKFFPPVSLLGHLVITIAELLDVVLQLVGGPVGELLYLLIRNGSVRTILSPKLIALINPLGLGGLLGLLL